MALTKCDFDRLDSRIKSITEQSVEQIEINSDLPPTVEQLEDNNKTYSIMAAILFIDIRKSTYLTENSQAKSMVKIYRSFMRMAVDCVRKNGGVTRQFLGDRIMGVFIDSVDEEGNISERAVDKAVNAARSLQTVIDFSLNKHLKSNVNGKVIECGIGIDYGKVLVTWVGMHGVESDDGKEDEKSCVWVGNTTNYASKYSDIASGGEIFISESVYKNLSEEYKEVWTKSAKYKGTKLFQGYITKDYYLEFSEELGSPIKIEEDNTVELDTSSQLADGIKEIERLQDKLIQREKELAVLEEKLKKENEEYEIRYNNANTEKISAINEKEKIQKQLNNQIKETYSFIQEILKLRREKSQLTIKLNSYQNRLLRTQNNIKNKPIKIGTELEQFVYYFPDFNIEQINKVEDFHKNITKILKSELVVVEKELKSKILEINIRISEIDKEIEQKLSIKEAPKLAVDKVVDLVAQIKQLNDENGYYTKKKQLEGDISQATEDLSELKEKALDEICNIVNVKMYELNKEIYVDGRRAPTLNIHGSKYLFNTAGDTGTGTAFANLISFDLSVLELTHLPALAHDLPLLKNIENAALENIISIYSRSTKQIFIAIDKLSSYDEKAAHIINEHKVLQLSKDKLLFIKNWKSDK